MDALSRFLAAAALASLAAIFTLPVFTMPTMAQFPPRPSPPPPPPADGGRYSGAPGPIVGAGLPIFAIGYGVYWLVKRRRKTD